MKSANIWNPYPYLQLNQQIITFLTFFMVTWGVYKPTRQLNSSVQIQDRDRQQLPTSQTMIICQWFCQPFLNCSYTEIQHNHMRRHLIHLSSTPSWKLAGAASWLIELRWFGSISRLRNTSSYSAHLQSSFQYWLKAISHLRHY